MKHIGAGIVESVKLLAFDYMNGVRTPVGLAFLSFSLHSDTLNPFFIVYREFLTRGKHAYLMRETNYSVPSSTQVDAYTSNPPPQNKLAYR
jgi:hypothetical protein